MSTHTHDDRFVSTPISPELSTTANPANVGFLVLHPEEEPPKHIPGKHTYCSFLHVLKGSGQLNIDDYTYQLKTGSVYLSLPGQIIHSLQTTELKAVMIFAPALYLLKCEPSLFQMRFLQNGHQGHEIDLTSSQGRDVFRLESHLMHEINANLPLKERTLECMFRLYLLTLERYYRISHEDLITEEAESNVLAQKFQACLNLNYDYSVSLGELADMLETTSSHLNHVIRKHTGKSARQHIHDKMLIMAKSFLTNTHYNIEEISYLLGFHFPQYFDRVFKKDSGQTPTDFRSEKASA